MTAGELIDRLIDKYGKRIDYCLMRDINSTHALFYEEANTLEDVVEDLQQIKKELEG